MIGNELIPLNLMDPKSDLYKSHAKKYIGREALMEETIPLLNCKWNDVVQFSALDPQIILNELFKVQPTTKLTRMNYFKIKASSIIDKYEAVIFNRKTPKTRNDFGIEGSEVSVFDQSYREIKSVPFNTKNFWSKAKAKGQPLLLFPYIPHILVRAKIDTSDFEVCRFKLPPN